MPSFPIDGDIVVNDAFLNQLDAYCRALQADLRKRKSEVDDAGAKPVVRTGSPDFTEGALLATKIGTVLTNVSASFAEMDARLTRIIGGIAYLRRETDSAEDIAKMTAEELLSYLATSSAGGAPTGPPAGPPTQ